MHCVENRKENIFLVMKLFSWKFSFTKRRLTSLVLKTSVVHTWSHTNLFSPKTNEDGMRMRTGWVGRWGLGWGWGWDGMRMRIRMKMRIRTRTRTRMRMRMKLRSSVCSDADYGTESSGSNPHLSCEFYHATQLLAYWQVVLNYNSCQGSLRWMT